MSISSCSYLWFCSCCKGSCSKKDENGFTEADKKLALKLQQQKKDQEALERGRSLDNGNNNTNNNDKGHIAADPA